MIGVLSSALFGFSGWCSTPEATILRIQSDLEAGKIDSAETAIDVALKDNPQDGGLYNLRGIVHANRGEMKAAEVDFTKAIHFSPQLVGAYLNFGRACEMLRSGDGGALDRAIVQYRKLLKLQPASHDVRLQLAKLLEERESYASSLHELDLLPASGQNDGLAIALRCGDLVGLGRGAEAESVAKRLGDGSSLDEQAIDAILPSLLKNKADSILIRMLELAGHRQALSPQGQQELAAAYERRDALPEARKTLEIVASTDPANAAPLMELARIAQKQNDFKGALGYLAHARELRPDYAPVHFFFGIVCIELNLPLEAKKSLQKALDLDPGNPAYNYARGSVELQGRSAWQAIPYFKKFIAAAPNDPRGHFALGVAEFASEDYDSSEKEMTLVCGNKETMAGANISSAVSRKPIAIGPPHPGISRNQSRSIRVMPTPTLNSDSPKCIWAT